MQPGTCIFNVPSGNMFGYIGTVFAQFKGLPVTEHTITASSRAWPPWPTSLATICPTPRPTGSSSACTPSTTFPAYSPPAPSSGEVHGWTNSYPHLKQPLPLGAAPSTSSTWPSPTTSRSSWQITRGGPKKPQKRSERLQFMNQETTGEEWYKMPI